ncbi:MAG: HAMP domain-containing histidine kinase [Acidobacteria bacterium]|nr:HAMP domain-containing histidine kinase [Acidobacteriota bacterium]
MNLRKKLALASGLVTLVTVGVLAVSAYVIASHELRSQVDDSLKSRAATIVREIDRALDRRDIFGRQRAPLGPTLLQPEFDAVTQVVDANGAILASLGPAELPVNGNDLQLAVANVGFVGRFANAQVEGKSYRVYTLSLPAGGALQLGRDITDIEDARSGLRTWLVIIGLVGIALATLVGWIIARRTTRPIEQLARSADDIARTQNTSDSIDINATGEIGNLVTSFNTMVGALGRSLAQQKQLVQDASHELRTPLTSLRANAELLERPDLPAETRREIVNDMRAEVDELTALSSELSALASDQRSSETPVQVRLDDAMRDLVERAQRRSGREIRLHASDAATVPARPNQLDRAVSNLIDNALKFSPPNTPIDVFVRGTRIEVHDSGPGIAPDDRPYVFDRFYRAAATRAMPGSGLGLAIVKQFADIHGAQTLVGASGTGGAMVGIDLAPTATWGGVAHTIGAE